jgi:hypothetical protein
MNKIFGKLEKVDPRELWNGEASDFTPWLAQEENITYLGNAIGIELEVQEQEQQVGVFRADILCTDAITNHFVLIENQLERTDHTHLGQLMTYAAGLEAVTIIWIARTFAEEHRAALDWLNSVTDESINFFGIEIEAYRIGDSLPAPNFNVVAKPNDWTKSVKELTKAIQLSETQKIQLEYWQGLKDFLEKSGSFLRCQSPYPQSSADFSLGKSNIFMAAVCSFRDNFIRVDVYFMGEKGKERFKLMLDKYEVDSMTKLGNDLTWDELLHAQMSKVFIQKPAEVKDRNKWNEQFGWFKENIEKLDTYFRPKIKEL